MLEIAVCDDDIADLECAVNMLHKIFTSQKIAYHIEKFMSANQMLENISRIDIGILDISMEELNGIKLGRKLKEKFPDVKLVYITSYEEYCMQVINEVHAFSFLCKPLEYDKLELQILELLNQLPDSAVESSGKVPKEFKQQMKNWIHDLISTISTRGWNNVPDMTLSILYGKSGLKDMNQLITYQYEADRMNRQWYSVL
ncbi:MAG: LytR/AlgR family response regulator transcription factor [Roseburia hominis]|jgi:two-component SAPR family response regulator|uniref:Stage 0 sporulation protein A homolog n=4 Tax=Lachnospiraceae TaxID=186803 RepID=C0FZQ0_9FIRM|nr:MULTISPECIES: response regulator [Lachnospiraceae]RHQ77389.1 response regulator [Firmicutes bacterium AF22-6AC]EEG91770.1 response regulator receiver domain protein [Roseburia inulinivorans DSM 16841]MCC3341516.1 response regulator [Roseburia inulinivorans DSM 16841]MCG4787090.1 response regulator [Roseburia faecis]RHA86162.1 response regulator [Roseburia inulinivorans]